MLFTFMLFDWTVSLQSDLANQAKTPCIEESETAVLVFLLIENWSPKQGRVGSGCQNLFSIPNK